MVDELGGVVVNNVHVGAGAQASRRGAPLEAAARLDRLGKLNLGKLGYPIGAFLAAFKPPQVRLRVEVDGQVVVDIDDPVLMVAIGNGTSVGGGTELTPEADPEDGKVDVMISRAVGPARQVRVRRCTWPRASTTSATTCIYLRGVPGHRLGRGLLLCGRRRDQRARAAPQLARRAGGVLHGPAVVPVSPHSQPRRAASTPAWNRESTPSSVSRPPTRRRTVRRLMPRVRAICSSLAPCASWLEEEPAQLGAARPPPRPGRGAGWPSPTTPRTSSGQGVDQAGLPDQRARLVDEPERLGEDAWVAPMMNMPGGQLGHQPDLLTDRRPAARGPAGPRPALGRGRSRGRRGPAHGVARPPRPSRPRAASPLVGPQPQQVARALRDQRGSRGTGLPPELISPSSGWTSLTSPGLGRAAAARGAGAPAPRPPAGSEQQGGGRRLAQHQRHRLGAESRRAPAVLLDAHDPALGQDGARASSSGLAQQRVGDRRPGCPTAARTSLVVPLDSRENPSARA